MKKIMHPIEPEELMAYLDGELTANRAAEAANHLGECAECQSIVAGFRGVSQNLRTWKTDLAESEMPWAVATALAESRPESREVSSAHRRSWREVLGQHWAILAWAGAMAAVLLIVFGTVRLPGGNANKVLFSQDGSFQPEEMSRSREQVSLQPPSAAPVNGRQFDKRAQLSHGVAQPNEPTSQHDLTASGPMIIRTAQLNLITKEFDKARAQLEAILKRHRGYVGELKVNDTTGSGRTLTATLRIPADQLDATLTEVKTLGRVEAESQSGQDVTSQYVDLQARLSNARNTEQRLTDLLRNRTGKLSDVLEVEQELDRVRGEIEQMEAERKNMSNQVSYATLNATIAEDYQAQLQVVPPSTSTRLSNAAVEGYRSMADGVVSLALFLLSTGPSLLLWGVVLFLPARLIWKRVRRSVAS